MFIRKSISRRYFTTEVEASLVKQLRQSTGAPLMQCKKALEDNQGSIEKAKQWLKEKGALVAQKKLGRDTSSGLAGLLFNQQRTKVSMLELNCETDFVAKSQGFADTGRLILRHLHGNIRGFDYRKTNSHDLQLSSFLMTKLESGLVVKESITELINKTQENINLTKLFQTEVPPTEVTGGYIHREVGQNMGGIACSVFLECSGSLNEEERLKLQAFSDQLATHITGMQPKYTQEEFKKLPYSMKMKEMTIQFGEGAQVKDKQREYGKKRILEEQEYVFQNELTVKEKLRSLGSELGTDIKIKEFVMIVCD